MFQMLFAIAVGALLPYAGTGQPSFASTPVQAPAIVNMLSIEQSLLDLTNADRVINGVSALEFDPQTIDIARQRAEIQLGPQSLSHYDSAGTLVFVQLLQQSNLAYVLAGENLARSSTDDPTVATRVEQALMESPLHRKNILDPTFKRVAVGVATDTSGQITFAVIYRD